MTEPQTHQPPAGTTDAPGHVPGQAPGLLAVVRHQRKVILVGLVLMVACFWFMGQVGEWRTAALTAFGMLLDLLNRVATERGLGRLKDPGDEPPRETIAAS